MTYTEACRQMMRTAGAYHYAQDVKRSAPAMLCAMRGMVAAMGPAEACSMCGLPSIPRVPSRSHLASWDDEDICPKCGNDTRHWTVLP
jgi:hypothetical protein